MVVVIIVAIIGFIVAIVGVVAVVTVLGVLVKGEETRKRHSEPAAEVVEMGVCEWKRDFFYSFK